MLVLANYMPTLSSENLTLGNTVPVVAVQLPEETAGRSPCNLVQCPEASQQDSSVTGTDIAGSMGPSVFGASSVRLNIRNINQ